MLIVLTGQTGVGKSELLKHAKASGYQTLEMDQVVKDKFYVKDHPVFNTLVSWYGPEIVKGDQINPQALGPIILPVASELAKVSALVNPFVKEFLKTLQGHWVIEMATYMNYEATYQGVFKKVIWVTRAQANLDDKFTYLAQKVQPIQGALSHYDLMIKNDGPIQVAATIFLNYLKFISRTF